MAMAMHGVVHVQRFHTQKMPPSGRWKHRRFDARAEHERPRVCGTFFAFNVAMPLKRQNKERYVYVTQEWVFDK